jgi:CheY-like chemotaxis protein
VDRHVTAVSQVTPVSPQEEQLDKSREEQQQEPRREKRFDPRARVLVVEDEHDLREVIAQWLQTKGYEAIEAADGEDAINLLEAGLQPDAIVLDLALPRVNGHKFLEWLRSNPDHQHRPVIVATGEYDDLPPDGVDGTLVKPYRPDLLARELERILAP